MFLELLFVSGYEPSIRLISISLAWLRCHNNKTKPKLRPLGPAVFFSPGLSARIRVQENMAAALSNAARVENLSNYLVFESFYRALTLVLDIVYCLYCKSEWKHLQKLLEVCTCVEVLRFFYHETTTIISHKCQPKSE